MKGLSSTFGLNADNIENAMGKLLLKEVSKETCDLDLVSNLIENGASLDVRDAEGNTPLMHAALRGYEPIVFALLNSGVSASDKNKEGLTAADMAVMGGNKGLIEGMQRGVKGVRMEEAAVFLSKGAIKLS